MFGRHKNVGLSMLCEFANYTMSLEICTTKYFQYDPAQWSLSRYITYIQKNIPIIDDRVIKSSFYSRLQYISLSPDMSNACKEKAVSLFDKNRRKVRDVFCQG